MNWRARLYQFVYGRLPTHLISRVTPICDGRARTRWCFVTMSADATYAGKWRRIPELTVESIDVRRAGT